MVADGTRSFLSSFFRSIPGQTCRLAIERSEFAIFSSEKDCGKNYEPSTIIPDPLLTVRESCDDDDDLAAAARLVILENIQGNGSGPDRRSGDAMHAKRGELSLPQ